MRVNTRNFKVISEYCLCQKIMLVLNNYDLCQFFHHNKVHSSILKRLVEICRRSEFCVAPCRRTAVRRKKSMQKLLQCLEIPSKETRLYVVVRQNKSFVTKLCNNDIGIRMQKEVVCQCRVHQICRLCWLESHQDAQFLFVELECTNFFWKIRVH